MPSILLDFHVSEAAMKRHDDNRPHRWGHRSDRNRPTTVATVVATAGHAPAARHLGGVKRLDPTPLDFSDLRDDGSLPDWAKPAPINENLAAIRAYIDQAPYIRHEDAIATALAAIAEQLAEPGSWPSVAYDLARSLTVSNELAKRPTPDRIDLRDFDGYLALAAHENAIASIQMDIYADRSAAKVAEQLDGAL